MKSAVIYYGKTGFTGKCADVLKSKLNGEVDIYNINISLPTDLEKYDTIIIGSGIYIGKIYPKIKKFIDGNLSKILKKNIGIFITSGENRDEYINKNFPKDILDKAIIKEHFGAGLDSKKLPFMEKLLLKIIGKCRDFCEMDNNAIERTAKAVNSLDN